MRELFQVGQSYLPAAWLSDTSEPRRFTGSVRPDQAGATLAVNDQWLQVGVPTPPPPPPSGKTMLIGASPEDYDNLHTTLLNLDGSKPGGVNAGLQIRRSYITGNCPSSWSASGNPASGDVARGCASYLSVGGEDITQAANGDSGTLGRWASFAASVPKGHLLFLTWKHEADNGKVPSGSEQAFQTGTANLYHAVKNANPDVMFGPLLTDSGFGYGTNNRNAANLISLDPTDKDFIGVDTYEFWRPQFSPFTDHYAVPNDPKAKSLGQQRTPDYLCGQAKSFADKQGKKLVVGEYSSHGMPAHPSFYSSGTTVDTASRPWRQQRFIDYFDDAGALALMLYHSSLGESGPWWQDCFHNFNTPTDRSVADPDNLAQIRTMLSTRVRTG